jgi:hypothetical protein
MCDRYLFGSWTGTEDPVLDVPCMTWPYISMQHDFVGCSEDQQI